MGVLMRYIILMVCMVFLTEKAHTETHQCFPENDLYISSDDKSAGTVTKDEFDKAVQEMRDIYTPLFQNEYNATLDLQADWEDGTVNAFAQQLGRTWRVKMFGGLARHPEATLDGFRAVICHEIGHHIAGAPRKSSWFGVTWASNEGQSDYYATTKCLRKLFSEGEHVEKTLKVWSSDNLSEDEQHAKNLCDSTYYEDLDKAVCLRGALAGQSLARLLGSLSGNAEVSFSNPDQNEAERTNHNHPQAQCRMDTYFQGALCINDPYELADARDATKGYCTLQEEFEIGLRPHCWYKPSEYER